MTGDDPNRGDQTAGAAAGVNEVAFLVGSPHRIRILQELFERGTRTRDDLRDCVDASRTTVQRNVQALEERGWITNSSVEYSITPCGALVAAELLDVIETTALATELRDVLRWLPQSEIGFDLHELQDARITVSRPANPYAPANRHAETLAETGRFQGLITSLSLPALNAVHPRVAAEEGDWTIVAGVEALDTLDSSPEYADGFEDFRDADCVDLYSYDGSVPFYLGLVGETVQLGLENDEGMPQALIESDSPAVRDWAERTLAEYERESDAVQIISH